MRLLTTETFIEKANLKHNFRYDYSKVIYEKCDIKIEIICKKHGSFFQKPGNHLYGQGCPLCKGSNISKSKTWTQEIFLKKCRKVHGSKFDYEKSKYVAGNLKVLIKCNECKALFEQTPDAHLNQKQGCPYCANKKIDTNEFVKRSKIKHGDKYDYSKSIFVSCYRKVVIICPKHGEFKQNPIDHYNGNGCSLCKESKGEERIRLFLERKNINFIKEKKFRDCKNTRYLPFDFYLKDYNVCIEFQGKQHYEAIEHFGGIAEFEIRKKHDKIKENFCLKNNIELILISYKDIKNIDKILEGKLTNLQFISILN